MNYLELSGSNYKIGYNVGYWWATYFLNNRKAAAMKTLLRWYDYFGYLQDSWDIRNDRYAALLRNTMNWYPEIIEEIAGMEKGVSDSFHYHKTYLSVSFLDMFCLALGETDDPDYNCSSAVLKTPQGYLLAHNDEYNTQFPLLMAKVACKANGRTKHFVSVSYPFQLLGSSAGMNSFLAFSGNSIGCKKQMSTLRLTHGYRIPKTVFSRKLLDAETIQEATDILSQHHTTLPNHHYIIFKNKAYSLQIRPLLSSSLMPSKQVTAIEIDKSCHFHTNHFIKGKGFDMKWTFNVKGELGSLRRYKYLSNILNHHPICDDIQTKIVFLGMAKDYRFHKNTAASLFFQLGAKQSSLEGHFYFDSGFTKKIVINHGGHSSKT